MAKTLKDFLNERKQLGPMKVKNPDEQKFIDKHVIAKIADRNGNDDELFKGSKVKMADRPSHRKGYNPGEDEEVYEEVEQIDELSQDTLMAYRKAAPNPKYGKDEKKTINRLKGYALAGHKLAKLAKEESEQIDELSQDKLMAYRSAAKKQGTGIQDRMKVGGGDWSKDGKDTKTLKKRMAGYKMAGRKVNPGLAATAGKAPRVAANEEVELEEKFVVVDKNKKIMHVHGTIDAANKKAQSKGLDPEEHVMTHHYWKRTHGPLRKEEAEQLDELSPSTMASYTKKAAADFAKRKPKMGYDGQLKKMQNRKVGVDRALKKVYGEEAELEEKLNMDKASMGDVIKDFQDSDAPQFKGKSDKKRRAMAIAAKLTAERGGKPLNKEERLLAKLGDISESHQRTMVSVFEKLNEDNQRAFMAACDTPEGVDQMLDFAIQNRGE